MRYLLCIDLEARPALCDAISLLDSFPVFFFAQSPSRALFLCRKEALSVIILDLEAKQFSGPDLAILLRKKYPCIDVVLLAGDTRFALEAFRIFASGYLLPPYTPEKL